MYTEDNDYGCTKRDGVSDMTETNGTLIQQMDKAQIHYTRTTLNIGAASTEPAYLLHYTSPKTNAQMTVLVFPQAGIDSWAEDYYFFAGMTINEASKLNWYDVYEHVHRVSWETIKSKVPVASKCPNCGKLDGIDGGGSYEDIRGKKRCSFCHTLKS